MEKLSENGGLLAALETNTMLSAKVDALMAMGINRTLIARAVGSSSRTIGRWLDGFQDQSIKNSQPRDNLNALAESMRVLISSGLPPPNARPWLLHRSDLPDYPRPIDLITKNKDQVISMAGELAVSLSE